MQCLKGSIEMALNGKIALVTGASRGIGACIADQLAASGANVIGTATSEAGAEKIQQRLQSLSDAKMLGVVLNLSDAQSIEHAIAQAADQIGNPNIIINNAGLTDDDLFIRMKEAVWSKVIDSNLTGSYRVIKACLRPMIKARWGRIVNVSSVVAASGNPGQANYCAAKAGLLGLTKSLAQEIANRGITVNAVAPGFIATDMTDSLNEQQKQALLDQIPMQCMGEAKDIAAAVSFLVSDGAKYITGETLHINGGLYMN